MATSPQVFQLTILPERKIDRRAVAIGYVFLVLALLALINLRLLYPEQIELRQYHVTELVPLPALRPEEPEPEKVEPEKAKPLTPEPVVIPDHPKLLVPPEVKKVPPPQPVEPPKVVMNEFAAPDLKIAAATPKLVHTGDFANNEPPPTVKPAVQSVQTGGFGDPNGLKGEGKPGAKLFTTQTGSFDMPLGPGQGNGKGGAKGSVGSADFGNGITTTGGGAHGSVSTGGFGSEQIVHNGPKIAQVDAGPGTKPVEITFKPNPVYTDEARALKLEGEVLLEVLFGADGTLHVNRVVRGLGHGLDEAAVAAANKMRFKPALRMGQPVDSTAIVHVSFQMAY
jgi:TonB family protein